MLELIAGQESTRMLQLLVRLSSASTRCNEWVMEALEDWTDTVHLLASTLAANLLTPCGLAELERTGQRAHFVAVFDF